MSAMLSNKATLSIYVLTSLLAGNSEATCVDSENTSIPESTPTSNYSILQDGTLTAPGTGLMWKRCLEGQTLTDGVCVGTPATYTWEDALVAADAVSFAGHGDWRLPNPKELLTIFEDRCSTPALNTELFPIYDPFGLWTATPADLLLQDIYSEVWVLNWNGGLTRYSKYQNIAMLLVRDLP